MLPIAGQRAGPIGLKYFVDTQGWSWSVIIIIINDQPPDKVQRPVG